MMELYRCANCTALFEKPDVYEWKEEMSGDGWAWETFREYYCPICGSPDIERYYGGYDDAETDHL